MLKRVQLVLLCVLIVLSAAGCSPAVPNSPTEGYVYTDAAGEEVMLPMCPDTTAVLFSSFADIWMTAGGQVDITVAESVERGFAAENAILVDGGAGKSIDLEALLSAKPDLVIGSADIPAQQEAVQICRDAGIPAVALQVEDFAQYLEVLQLFCVLTDQPENYDTYGMQLQTRIEKLREDYADVAADKTFLFIRAGSSAKFTKAKLAKDHFACAMIEEFGTYNIAEKAPVLLDGLSFEEILVQDPDMIFVSTMGDEQAATEYMDSVLAQPAWQNLTAVKQGNVYYLPKTLFQYKPNADWEQAYLYLLDLLR